VNILDQAKPHKVYSTVQRQTIIDGLKVHGKPTRNTLSLQVVGEDTWVFKVCKKDCLAFFEKSDKIF